jgi:hypothetical protein
MGCGGGIYTFYLAFLEVAARPRQPWIGGFASKKIPRKAFRMTSFLL